MVRYIFRFQVADVVPDLMLVVRVICTVCYLGMLVPFAREYALAADSVETAAQAADTRKQVDECERVFRRRQAALLPQGLRAYRL